MHSSRLLWLLVMMAAITALSTDIYLPSAPDLVDIFHTNTAAITQTITVFIGAFALGQLLFAPLSDRFGRRRPLIAGLTLYVVANILCALATSVEILTLARGLQGLGACTGFVSCTAIVRDTFQGPTRTAAMAKIAMVVSLAPIVAPILGSCLHVSLGWQWSFLFLAIFGSLLLFTVIKQLPESKPADGAPSGYLKVLAHGEFRCFALSYALSFAALYAFIGNSSHILVTHFGMATRAFALLFATNAIAYMLGSFLASRIAMVHGSRALCTGGALFTLAGGLTMSLLAHLPSPMAVLGPMYMVTFGVALVSPAASAAALEPFGKQAAAASALLGFIRFTAAAVVLSLNSILGLHPVVGLAATITGCAVLSLLLLLVLSWEARKPVDGPTWTADHRDPGDGVLPDVLEATT